MAICVVDVCPDLFADFGNACVDEDVVDAGEFGGSSCEGGALGGPVEDVTGYV